MYRSRRVHQKPVTSSSPILDENVRAAVGFDFFTVVGEEGGKGESEGVNNLSVAMNFFGKKSDRPPLSSLLSFSS